MLAGFGPRKPDLHLVFLFYPANCFCAYAEMPFVAAEKIEPALHGTGEGARLRNVSQQQQQKSEWWGQMVKCFGSMGQIGVSPRRLPLEWP